MSNIASQLNEAVRRVVRKFDPDRIMLFGSRARGTGNRHSDIDLLIVMPVAGSKRAKRIEVRCTLHNIKMSKDIVLVTPEEFESRRHIPGTLVRTVVQEGKVSYARAG